MMSKTEIYRRYKAKHPKFYRRSHLWRLYRLTLEKYDAMVVAQCGRCAICDQPQQERGLSVDHNHQTGAVRGLLCAVCNTRLFAVEDIGWRARAESYLKLWGTK